MDKKNKSMDENHYQNRNNYLVLILLCFSSLAFPLSITLYFAFGISTLIIVASAMITICSIAWILFNKKLESKIIKPIFREFDRLNKGLQILFWLLITLSIIFYYFRPENYIRPLSFFILILISILIIFLQVLSQEKFSIKHKILILINIIIIGLILRISELYIYNSVLGVDPWYHQYISNFIINTGNIPVNQAYTNLPIYHIETAIGSAIFNLSYKNSVTITIILIQTIVPSIIVYRIGKMIVNEKIGLIGALLLIISDQWVKFGYWVIPNTLAAILVILIIFCIIKYWQSHSIQMGIVLLIFTFTLVLTHSFSSLYLLVMLSGSLVALWLHNRLTCEKNSLLTHAMRNYVILFFVSLFAWWTYVSFHIDFLARFIEIGFYSPETIVIQNLNLAHEQKYITQKIVDGLGQICYLVFAYFGLLLMLCLKRNDVNRLYIWISVFSLICIPIAFIPGITLLGDRWGLFAQGLLCIPLAILISRIDINWLKCKNMVNNIKPVVGIIAIMSLTFLLLMNTSANMDNPILSGDLAIKRGLTDSELLCAGFASEYYNRENMVTDNYYVLGFYEYYVPNPYIIDNFNNNIINSDFSELRGFILLRDTVANGVHNLGGPWKNDFDIYTSLYSNNAIVIYSNEKVGVYYL